VVGAAGGRGTARRRPFAALLDYPAMRVAPAPLVALVEFYAHHLLDDVQRPVGVDRRRGVPCWAPKPFSAILRASRALSPPSYHHCWYDIRLLRPALILGARR